VLRASFLPSLLSLACPAAKRHGFEWLLEASMARTPDVPAMRSSVGCCRRQVQAVTIAWMTVEAAVSLFAAWRASSPALLAFGGDRAIELLSAVVVGWRFLPNAAHEHMERRAARAAGALLFALAAYVVTASVMALLGYSEPRPTYLGISILVAAAAIMPWLAKEKRRLSAATGSAALRADAAESALCACSSMLWRKWRHSGWRLSACVTTWT
jgi:hypothetical protein